MLKKISVIIIVLMLSVCFSGCSDAGNVSSQPSQKSVSDETSGSDSIEKSVTDESSAETDISADVSEKEGSEKSSEKNISAEEISYVTGSEGEKIPYATEYSDPGTFQYTEQMISDMNKDNDDFEISFDGEKGHIHITGLINTSPVNSERDVLEKLMLVRSIIGLTDTRTQLYCDEKTKSGQFYSFHQCYAGIRLYSSGVKVWLDDENRIADLDVFVVSDTDALKKTDLENLVDPPVEGCQMVIWDMGEYKKAPVPAYICSTSEETTITDANTGKEIDSWPNIID